MISETISAVSGIKTALDIAKGVASLKNTTEINQAVIDIQRALLEAQAGAFEDRQTIAKLTDQISELQKQLKTNADWEAEKARYVLTKSPKGAYTYNLRADLESEIAPHKLCSNCFDQGQKSVLQTIASGNGGEVVDCPRCKSRFELSEFYHPPIQDERNYF
jgi:hypothetical protein